jgi:hypothetical protein
LARKDLGLSQVAYENSSEPICLVSLNSVRFIMIF